MTGDLVKPVVGFDAMIRLEVDVPSLVPEVRMSLIGLSQGNVMKQWRPPGRCGKTTCTGWAANAARASSGWAGRRRES